ncbi:MAG: endo-1,4-beta-xylanase [Rhodoferax sp.]|nr:endo-1,4-beta-xylanase [Rhodoferax sp.]
MPALAQVPKKMAASRFSSKKVLATQFWRVVVALCAALPAAPALPQAFTLFPANTAYTLEAPAGGGKLSREFFGMHMHRSEEPGNWPDIAFGSWRLWDAYAGWAWLEPALGNWQFAKLDGYIARATSAGITVLLPLGVTPRWASARPNEPGIYGQGMSAEPADMERWRQYVRVVATRYAGRVAAYQVLNEANTTPFYTGTIGKLVEMTRIAREEIRRADPKALLVAPSGVGLDKRVAWVRDFLAAGGAQYVDAASFHLYHSPMPPEAMVPRIMEMRDQLAAGGFQNIPLWNTETGYFTDAQANSPQPKWTPSERQYVTTNEAAGQYAVRAMLLARVLGFERFYWYAWDNEKLGFIEPGSKTRRPIARALERAIVILLRSEVKRCDRSVTGLWNCQLVLANGKNARAVWTDAGASPKVQTISLVAPATIIKLDGEPIRIEGQSIVEADGSVRLILE